MRGNYKPLCLIIITFSHRYTYLGENIMSRSYRDPSFSKHNSYFKEWRSAEHRRYRRNTKQTVEKAAAFNETPDLPKFKCFSNLYNSPLDGRLSYQDKPLENNCQKTYLRGWCYNYKKQEWYNFYGIMKMGHHKICHCLSNTDSWYNKNKRK